jgi:hypothetical protein
VGASSPAASKGTVLSSAWVMRNDGPAWLLMEGQQSGLCFRERLKSSGRIYLLRNPGNYPASSLALAEHTSFIALLHRRRLH